MAYTINHYDGSPGSVIADGTIDNTFDLKLIGKNYAGYGEVQNENLLFLLENFAGTTQPGKATRGQIWFDSGNRKLKFFDGTKFRTTGGAETGTTAPTGLTIGDFWWDTANEQLYACTDGTHFALIGPQGVTGSGTTQMISRSIQDTNGEPHPIIEAVINDQTVFIISKDEFAINEADITSEYSYIKNGLTLAYSPTGVTSTDFRFYGTATNADKLGGISASNFVQAGSADFSGNKVHFGDLGYTVGGNTNAQSTLQVYIDAGTTPIIQNNQNDTIEFKTTVGGAPKTPLVLKGSNILPGLNIVSDIGSTSLRFANVYATTFNGIATQSNSLNVDGYYRTASVAPSANTIPVRDSSGNIYANIFQGTATSAQFADLAEKYLADAEYEVGTVVMIGGEKEITASQWGKRAIGVVSGSPAFLMNKDLEGGTAVALKGRVPVKVTGRVKKGDELIAAQDGTAMVAVPHSSGVFAVALESSDDSGVKLVEALVL